MSKLLEGVEQMVATHKKSIYTVDGFEIHERAGLLEQLHDAVFGGMEKTGGSSPKARLPISEAAADLYALIDRQIAEAWAGTLGRSPLDTAPEALLAEWAAAVRDEAIITVTFPEQIEKWDAAKNRMVPRVIHVRAEYHPLDLLTSWINQIEDFLNPDRTAGIKAPCIQCGASKVSRRRDGETTMTDAMVFRRDKDSGRTLDARCLNCGVIWPPSQFEFLAKALGLEVPMSEPPDKVEV